MVVAAAAAGGAQPPGLRRSGTMTVNVAAMSRPRKGPDSEFFRSNLFSKAACVNRNTTRHWHVHWYMISRGRPLIRGLLRNKLSLQSMTSTADLLTKRVKGTVTGKAPPSLAEASSFAQQSLSNKPHPPGLMGLRSRLWDFSENHPVPNTLIFLVISRVVHASPLPATTMFLSFLAMSVSYYGRSSHMYYSR